MHSQRCARIFKSEIFFNIQYRNWFFSRPFWSCNTLTIRNVFCNQNYSWGPGVYHQPNNSPEIHLKNLLNLFFISATGFIHCYNPVSGVSLCPLCSSRPAGDSVCPPESEQPPPRQAGRATEGRSVDAGRRHHRGTVAEGVSQSELWDRVAPTLIFEDEDSKNMHGNSFGSM